MRVLVVTGRRAKETVHESVDGRADVLALDLEIAAFISPRQLQGQVKDDYDLILVPGLVEGDFTPIERETGARVRLGPKHAYDLARVLPYLDSVELSRETPACELLRDTLREEAERALDELEANAKPYLSIGGVKIGGDSRMKVMAEIVSATLLTRDDLARKIGEFEARGADIIDLGAHIDATPQQVETTLGVAREVTSLPVSIDTLEPQLLEAGARGGADLLLSLDSNALQEVGDVVAEEGVPAVVVPDSDSGFAGLIRNIEEARARGITVIADPVLDPIGHGLADSIERYKRFRDNDPETPLFWGVGNVTELIDADTVGVNAALTGVAMELQADILFTPEYSDKARGSIKELKTAAGMMQLARHRNTEPKDLGIDLLILKEKRRREEGPWPDEYVRAREESEWGLDPKGCFRIWIHDDYIVANHPRTTIVGRGAREIMDTIIRHDLVSRLDHAAYLGRELQKAELAIKYGRSYAQEDEW